MEFSPPAKTALCVGFKKNYCAHTGKLAQGIHDKPAKDQYFSPGSNSAVG